MKWVPLFGPTVFVVGSLVGLVWGVGAIFNDGWCPGSAEGGCTSEAALLAAGGILVLWVSADRILLILGLRRENTTMARAIVRWVIAKVKKSSQPPR
jgi:hypothetical protein